MKALLNVMEQKKPAPEDINTLLMLTRDLLKKIPEGQSLPSLGFGAAFGGFGLEGITLAKTELLCPKNAGA